MTGKNDAHPNIAPIERRVNAIQDTFEVRGFKPGEVIVRFRSEDLRPDSADAALVHVAVFQRYLEHA